MPKPPKKEEKQKEFMKRCYKAFRTEKKHKGKSKKKISKMCAAMWYKHK